MIGKFFRKQAHTSNEYFWFAYYYVGRAAFYASVAGFSIPTQRTLYMLLVFAVAVWSGKKWPISQVLALEYCGGDRSLSRYLCRILPVIYCHRNHCVCGEWPFGNIALV